MPGRQRSFCSHLRADLESVVDKWRDRTQAQSPSSTADTFLYPTLQV